LPLSQKVRDQIAKAGLPTSGQVPYIPALLINSRGKQEIEKAPVLHGPKKNKVGYVDTQGRIWVRDRAHAGYPDHWDVQEDGGVTYFKVDLEGNKLA
jgi:hypothetical protein